MQIHLAYPKKVMLHSIKQIRKAFLDEYRKQGKPFDERIMGGVLARLEHRQPGEFDKRKVHSTSGQAFDCKVAHLIASGYERIGACEFQRANEPVLILTRRSRYGGELRLGKEGRFMGAHLLGGVIIG